MGVFVTGLVLLLCEALARAFLSPDTPLLRAAMQLKVCGEILAEPDRDLFWHFECSTPDNDAIENTRSELKVACMTDSVAVMYEGKGYPDLLQSLLDERFPAMEPLVFNAGVPGYTSYQGLKYFERDLLQQQFDVLVVCYGWNDHWQSNNGVPDGHQNTKWRRRARFIVNRSRLLSFVSALTARHRAHHYACTGPKRSVRVGLEDYARALMSFIDICQRHDIGLILMTAPFLLDEDADWTDVHEQYNDVVRQTSERRSVALIDLVDDFKDREDLFIAPKTDKVHYNWQGAEIVAQSIADRIATHIVTAGKGGYPRALELPLRQPL